MRVCWFGDGGASTTRGLDHEIPGNERQDRGFDPGAAAGQRIAGGDLGAAPGSARNAWSGGAAKKDDKLGHASEKPSACSAAKTALAASQRQSLRGEQQRMVAVAADREAGEAQSAKRPGNPAVCREASEPHDRDHGRNGSGTGTDRAFAASGRLWSSNRCDLMGSYR